MDADEERELLRSILRKLFDRRDNEMTGGYLDFDGKWLVVDTHTEALTAPEAALVRELIAEARPSGS